MIPELLLKLKYLCMTGFLKSAFRRSVLIPDCARVTARSGGILTTVAADCMTRSMVFEAPDAPTAYSVVNRLKDPVLSGQTPKKSTKIRLLARNINLNTGINISALSSCDKSC